MTALRLMIFSGYYPGSRGTGCILLRDACRCYPRDRVCCFSLMKRHPEDTDCDWVPTAFGNPHLPRWAGQAPTRLGRMLRLPLQAAAAAVRNARIVREAVAFGRQHQVEMVWGVLDWSVNHETAGDLAKRLGVPLVTTVWDAPEYRMAAAGYSRIVRHLLMRRFKAVMKNSVRCGVASDEMGEEYRRRYGVECVTLKPGTERTLWREPHRAPLEPGKLNIVFAGSLYALEEMQTLVDALGEAGWKAGGREVTLSILSMSPLVFHVDRPANIRVLGFHSTEETLRHIAEADVGYLPYWFRKDREIAVRQSFPGKMGTYLAAGLPILYHGPRKSTPMAFFERYPVAEAVNSLEPADILAAIERLASDGDVYRRCAAAGREALNDELGLHVYISHFAQLIGARREDLLPLEGGNS